MAVWCCDCGFAGTGKEDAAGVGVGTDRKERDGGGGGDEADEDEGALDVDERGSVDTRAEVEGWCSVALVPFVEATLGARALPEDDDEGIGNLEEPVS